MSEWGSSHPFEAVAAFVAAFLLLAYLLARAST